MKEKKRKITLVYNLCTYPCAIFLLAHLAVIIVLAHFADEEIKNQRGKWQSPYLNLNWPFSKVYSVTAQGAWVGVQRLHRFGASVAVGWQMGESWDMTHFGVPYSARNVLRQ